MSEMLGNQYFLARRYGLAAKELEDALQKMPHSTAIRKKLIICHVQQGNLDRALDILLSLFRDDISCILKTEPILDDCPCPELVYDFEERFKNINKSDDYFIKLSILWLYCDVYKSYDYLKQYQRINPHNQIVNQILDHLTAYLLSNDLKGSK